MGPRTLNLIPFIKNINKQNLKSGKKFLILDHDLIKYKDYKLKKKKIETLVLSGGSACLIKKFLIIFENPKKSTYIFGPLIKIKIYKNLAVLINLKSK